MKLRILILSTLLLAVFAGCKKDPCKDVNCLHGVCNDGSCICESGWTGEFCTVVDDPCHNVNCVNGTCVNGTCECDAGYEGSTCATAVNTKFAGNYQAYPENCNPSGPVSTPYSIAITTGALPSSITLTGLWETSSATSNATVGSDGRSFTIPRQLFGGSTEEIAGSGTLNTDATEIQITYTIYDEASGIPLDACNATLTRQ